jgi:Mg2+ and Co2+ transporter CorA
MKETVQLEDQIKEAGEQLDAYRKRLGDQADNYLNINRQKIKEQVKAVKE